MDDERLDLSALDPARDQLAWARRSNAVVAAVRPPSLAGALVGWSRPALALAAGLAAAVWIAGALRPARASQAQSEAQPADLLASWAQSGSVPSPQETLSALGVAHGTR